MLGYVDWIWQYVLPFLVILTILVFVHEFGHYWVARRNGVRVDVFSIGFGRELFGWNDKNGTRWKFSLIPLGGYVKMYGDADPTSFAPDEKVAKMDQGQRAQAFHHKKVWQRAAIVFAGPAINYVFAVVVLTLLFAIAGQPSTPAILGAVEPGSAAAQAGLQPGDKILRIGGQRIERFEEIRQVVAMHPGEKLAAEIERNGQPMTVTVTPRAVELTDKRGNVQVIGQISVLPVSPPILGSVEAGSAADQAGLKAGDKIVRIDGQPIDRFDDLRSLVSKRPGEPLSVEFERAGQLQTVVVTPRAVELADKRVIGMFGVRGRTLDPVRLDPWGAFVAAVEETWALTRITGIAIGQMIDGSRSTKDLRGPAGIAEMAGDMAQNGFYAFIWFLGVLSLQLCLINLLPVPMLDGGHLLFYGIEAVRRRPLGARAQEYGFRIGLALVLSLMVFVTWNDLVHLRVVEFFVNLVS